MARPARRRMGAVAGRGEREIYSSSACLGWLLLRPPCGGRRKPCARKQVAEESRRNASSLWTQRRGG